MRLARPLPYPAEQIRAVTLFAEGGQLWLAVTAAIHVQQHDLDPDRVAGVDLGVIHPYAVVGGQAALLISGRAIRAENYLHLRDHQAREVRAAHRASAKCRIVWFMADDAKEWPDSSGVAALRRATDL